MHTQVRLHVGQFTLGRLHVGQFTLGVSIHNESVSLKRYLEIGTWGKRFLETRTLGRSVSVKRAWDVYQRRAVFG